MAFTLQVIRGSTTYTISDPYLLEGAEGMGGASVRNIEESGPYQDGATHLDERLDPRAITLKLNVVGTSSSVLDGYRDTLMTIFKPVRGVPITLKVTRDDGTVRQIDTRRTGALDIPLVAINRPGNLHRAVVQLRAAEPLWYNPTAGTVTYNASALSWWTGGGAIPAANILDHVESPAAGDNIGGTSVAAGSPMTIYFKSPYVTAGSVTKYAYSFYTGGSTMGFFADSDFYGGIATTFITWETEYTHDLGNWIGAGTLNYFIVHSGTSHRLYKDTTTLQEEIPFAKAAWPAAGTAKFWRRGINKASSDWPVALPYAAVYNIALDETQRNGLINATSGTAVYGTAFAYAGDYDTYPIVKITGPIGNPVLTNLVTGDKLDFTGGTVGSAEVWTIDTRYGNKTATSGTTSVANFLSTDSDLASFRIVAAPIATGGTNVITLAGTVTSGTPTIQIIYNERYMSY